MVEITQEMQDVYRDAYNDSVLNGHPSAARHNALSAISPLIESAVRAEGWRAIGTAPKDGTQFWGLVGDDAIAMSWHPKFEAFVSSFHRMTMAPGYTLDGETEIDHSPIVHRPEWWTPIVPAPARTAP